MHGPERWGQIADLLTGCWKPGFIAPACVMSREASGIALCVEYLQGSQGIQRHVFHVYNVLCTSHYVPASHLTVNTLPES